MLTRLNKGQYIISGDIFLTYVNMCHKLSDYHWTDSVPLGGASTLRVLLPHLLAVNPLW